METELKAAVEKNDMEVVAELVMSGADLTMTDLMGNTFLHTAARLGYPGLCALLVNHGADINAQNDALFTPLCFAARTNLQTVRVLLDLGAEVQLCNHLGEIPLHAAASSGLVDVIVTLVSSGSDVNARSWQGLTPVYCAVGSGSRLAVKTLLGLGAEVNGILTPESRRNTDCVQFCEHPVCEGKEDRGITDNSSDCRGHVCVRVPRQRPFPDCQRQQPAQQILLGSEVCSESPGVTCSGLRPQHDCPDSSVRRQHQCGLSPGRVCQQQRPRRICHASHHPRQACDALHYPCGKCHSRHQHRLDPRRQRDASLYSCSVFHTFENEAESHPPEESLYQGSRIPVSPSKTRCCCYREVTQPQCPVHSNNTICTRGSMPICHFHLRYSTCPFQTLQRETQIQHTRTVPHSPTSEENNRPNPSTYLSVENSSEKADTVEEVTSPTHIRFLCPHLSTGRTAQPENGMTPLHHAAQLGMETVADVLLEAGADVNARTERGETPLHLAAWHSGISGHGESTGLLRLLLKAGASVEAVTTVGGFSPLHLAALAGDALCTSLLLSAGADLHARDSQGNCPLHKACERIVAPEANRLRTVRVLLTKGASARAMNDEGQTPLHVLLMHKRDDVDQDVVRLLLNHQADPNLPTPSGDLPLLTTLHHGMYSFAKVLVEKGADPNVLGQDGQTPLHIVSKDGQPQLFKLIWSKGGNPTRPDKKGWSPLRYAVESGDLGIVQACISSGASTFQPRHDVPAACSCVEDVFGNPARCLSPFQYTFAAAQLPLLVLLHQSGCFFFKELHRLKELCMVSSFQELTDPQHQVVSFVFRVGGTVPSLHNLCCWRISYLIGCGADRKWRTRQLGLPALLRDFVLLSASV